MSDLRSSSSDRMEHCGLETESKQITCQVEPSSAAQGEGIKIFVEEGAIRALEEEGAIKALENCVSVPVSVPEFDFMRKVPMKVEPGVQTLKKERAPKGLSPAQQVKKDLYAKLDEILITAMKADFEVHIGGTVDRLDMVHFLKNIVKQHLTAYPDLEKILALRDTVLTARVKRAFPQVEYKRKQIRQDHFRKASFDKTFCDRYDPYVRYDYSIWKPDLLWLYVNIRRKPSSCKNEHATAAVVSSNHSHTVCWMPQGMANSMETALSPGSNVEDQESESSSEKGEEDDREGSTEEEPMNPFNVRTPPGGASVNMNFIQSHERTALVLDNYTVIQWVKSKYEEDHTSYVPVQDVVKAFKNDFNYDISYKESHQMIYSAFTSPRQRSSPLKTVRVSSLGQQYVYRGITAKHPTKDERCVEGSLGDRNHIQEERDDLWKRMIEELKLERDQAVVERNQALSALMEMEKKHSDALERIEQLKKLCSETRRTSSNEDSPSHKKKWTSSWLNRPLEQSQEDISEKSPGSSGSTPSALDPYGINLFQKCAKCQEKDGVIKTYEKIKEERDQIWRDIVKQAHQERDEAVRKLETVRRERDHYLERMGKLEKVNKQLSSAAKKTQGVQASNTAQSRHDTVTNVTINGGSSNSKETLSPILAHLRSKRMAPPSSMPHPKSSEIKTIKQAMPSKFSKIPKLDSVKSAPGESTEHDRGIDYGRVSPVIADSGPPSPDTQDIVSSSSSRRESEEDKENNPDVEMASRKRISEVFEEQSSRIEDGSNTETTNFLVYTEGSGMVAFRPHPLEE